MSVVYETIVSVPENFIEKIIEKSLNWKLGIYARLQDNEFAILSKNYQHPGIEEILNLSQQYQDIVLTATSVCEMTLERADIFEISNGEIISECQNIWFNCLINPEDKKRLDPEVIKKFEKEAREYFNVVDNHLRRNYDSEFFIDLHEKKCSTMEYYYPTNDALLIAKRKDLENIVVDVEFLRDVEQRKSIDETEEASEMDGLPF